MSKNNGKKDIHSEVRDNIIEFPKPSTPSSSSSKKDVESGSRHTIHFEPDWDTDEDNSTDSTT